MIRVLLLFSRGTAHRIQDSHEFLTVYVPRVGETVRLTAEKDAWNEGVEVVGVVTKVIWNISIDAPDEENFATLELRMLPR